jgi:hypothetical protein
MTAPILPTLAVHVLAARIRPEAHDRLRASLAASDAADLETRWHVHPLGMTVREHLLAAYEAIAEEPGGDLVLVLEDDAVVGKHIAHNIRTWREPWQRSFAAGWVYNPGGYAQRDCWFADGSQWYGTVAVVYRRRTLKALVQELRSRPTPQRCFDNELSAAILRALGSIRVAYPSLVEHYDNLPSVVGTHCLGHPSRTSGGTFRADYRRDFDDHALFDAGGRVQLPPGGELVWKYEGPEADQDPAGRITLHP